MTLTTFYSYHNKGDAIILDSTIKFLRTVFRSISLTLVTIDYESFRGTERVWGPECVIYPLPLPTPLRNILSNLLGRGNSELMKGPYSLLYRFTNAAYMRWLTGLLGILLTLGLITAAVTFRRVDTNLNTIMERFDDADLVVAIGGGYLFSNLGAFLYLFPIIYAKVIAKRKVVFLCHSIGSLLDPFTRSFVRIVLERADAIVLREKTSYQYVKNSLKLRNKNLVLANDMAFLFARRSRQRSTKSHDVVGMNIRNWFFNDPRQFDNYFRSMVETAERLITHGYRVCLVPFGYILGREDDMTPSRLLKECIRPALRNQVEILNIRDMSAASILDLFGNLGFRFFIGTRVHSNVASWLSGVPTIAISYLHFITHGLAKDMQIERYVVDVESINSTTLMEKVMQLDRDHDRISRLLQERCISIGSAMLQKLGPLLEKMTRVDASRTCTVRQNVVR